MDVVTRERELLRRGYSEADMARLFGPSPNITDPDDEYWTGCTEDCPDSCEADHEGEQ